MNSQDTLNIVTISISTILSVGAIILSIWFYRESNKQNNETALMQADIKNAIQKLEQLYAKMTRICNPCLQYKSILIYLKKIYIFYKYNNCIK